MEKIFWTATIVGTLTLGILGTIRLPGAMEDREFANETARTRRLDLALAANVHGRMERLRILAELEAGAIDLDAALAQARPLNEDEPLCWDYLRLRYPEYSDEEIIGYQLVVVAALSKKISFVRDLVSRLGQRFGRPVPMGPHLRQRLSEKVPPS